MKAIIVSVVLLLAMVASAGPFGYEMGQKIEDDPHRIQNGWHHRIITSNLPAPFTRLALDYTPIVGLCRVRAFVETDDYAAQFYRLLDVHVDKYGKPTHVPGSEEPLVALWFDVNVDNVAVISLNTLWSALSVTYAFTNALDCNAEAKVMRQEKRSAGPFGYEMGQEIEGEPDGIDSDGLSYKFITHNVPMPFTELYLTYTPNAGLCNLMASVTTDDYDAQFRRIRVALTDKYGEPTAIEEESLSWINVNVGSIRAVFLSKHDAATESSADVLYVFTNYRVCEAEAKAMRQKDGLRDVL